MISPAREAGLLGSKGSALALQRPCCRSANLRPPRRPPSSKQLIQYRTQSLPFRFGIRLPKHKSHLGSLQPSPKPSDQSGATHLGQWGGGGRTESGGLLGCLQDSPLTSHCRCGHLSLLGLCPALPRGRTQCPVCRAPAPGCALVQVPRFAGRPGPSAQHSIPLPRHAPLWYKKRITRSGLRQGAGSPDVWGAAGGEKRPLGERNKQKGRSLAPRVSGCSSAGLWTDTVLILAGM